MQAVLIVGSLAALLLVGMLHPRWFLPMAVLSVIPVSIGVEWGVTFNLHKVVPIAFLLALVPLASVGALRRTPASREPAVVLFIAYIVMSSVLHYLILLHGPALYAARASLSWGRSPEGRPIVQLASLMLSVTYFFIAALQCRTPKDLQRMQVLYVRATFVMCLYAFYQFAAFYLGLPYTATLGLVRGGEVMEKLSTVRFGPLVLYRVSAICGEPKSFSTILLPSIAMLMWWRVEREKPVGWGLGFLSLCAHVVAVVLSWSTTGYFALGLFLVAFLFLQRGKGARRLALSVLAVLLVIGTVALSVRGSSGTSVPSPVEILRARTVARLPERTGAPAKEWATIDFLRDNPEFIPFGCGPGNLNLRARGYCAEFDNASPNYVYTPNSGTWLAIGEWGAVGFLLLYWSLYVCWSGTKRIERAVRPEEACVARTAAVALLAAATAFLIKANTPALFLFGGLAATVMNWRSTSPQRSSASPVGAAGLERRADGP